jgi:putative SOS response-associated peptidase YedK
MPAILPEEAYCAWLDPASTANTLQSLIATRNWQEMEAVAIAKLKPDELSTGEQESEEAEDPPGIFDENS